MSPGDRIDRFILLEELGSGGMGLVFLAYDPKLDRRIALKVLRPRADDGSRGAARLLREAQSLAKLSHPNVVVVHETGSTELGVFIAMEHVPGDTMLRWMKEAHDWREVVRVFGAAGRGVAAAHQVGLVHRDFKPANVLMGKDARRPRVVDFGLARPDAPSLTGSAPLALYEPSEPSTLTQTGIIVGTPRYMAPEQHLGQAGDPACDQFSFCVALFEALYGEQAFPGETSAELLVAKQACRLAEVARGRVPARLHQALLRGLSPKPEDRWPSMEALLTHLQRIATPRAKTNATIAGVGALGIAAAGWLAFAAPNDVCGGGQARVEAIWNDQARDGVLAAFTGSNATLAVATWERVGPAMDRYAQQWTAAHRQACEATEVRKEQSAVLLDQRMQCLDNRLRSLRALATALTQADPAVVQKAATAVAGLPRVARCAEPSYVAAQVRPPEDGAQRDEVERIRQVLADARAQAATGHYDRALDLLVDVDEAVQAVDYTPLQAEVAVARGSYVWHGGDYAEGEQILREALLLARRAGAIHLHTAAELALIEVLQRLDRLDDALWVSQLVEADALRENDERRRATVLSLRASVESVQGHHAQAIAHLHEALALRQETDPGSISEGAIHNTLATTLFRTGDLAGAEKELLAALVIARDKLGPSHPHVAASMSNLSMMLRDQGDIDGALVELDRAISIAREVLGARHPATAAYMDNQAMTLAAAGRNEEALTMMKDVLSIRLERLDPKAEKVAKTYNNIGVLLHNLGRRDEAIEQVRLALQIRRETLGERHPETIKALSNVGSMLAEAGKHDEGASLLERAIALRIEILGKDHPDVLFSECNLVALRIEQDRVAEARTLADSVLQRARVRLGPNEAAWIGVWTTQATVAKAEGQLGVAAEGFREAAEAADAAGHVVRAIEARVSLGELATERGEFDQARRVLLKAQADGRGADLSAKLVTDMTEALAALDD